MPLYALGSSDFEICVLHYINKTPAKGIPSAPGKLMRNLIHQESGAVANSMAKGGNIWLPYLILLYCRPTTYPPKWALALLGDQKDVECTRN